MSFKSFDLKFFLALTVLFLCTILVYSNIFSSPFTTKPLTNDFPIKISDWRSKDVHYDKNVLSGLAADKTIFKTYYKNGNVPITLFVAYYNTLEKADLSHSPVVCFTGQGWEILKKSRRKIPVNLLGIEKINVNQFIQKKIDTSMIALYWYQSANHSFSNRGLQKIFLFFNRLLGKPDCNAFVRVTIRIPPNTTVAETESYLYVFIRELYPNLRNLFLS